MSGKARKQSTIEQQLRRKGYTELEILDTILLDKRILEEHINQTNETEKRLLDLFDSLIELKHRDASVRRDAAIHLYRLEDKRAIPYLLPLLKDPDRGVQIESALALGRLEVKEAIPSLLDIVEFNFLTENAGTAFEHLKDIKRLRKKLLSIIYKMYSPAIYDDLGISILGYIYPENTPEALKIFRNMILGGAYGILTSSQITTIKYLTKVRDKESLPQIIRIMDHTANEDIKHLVVEAISELGTKKHIPILKEELSFTEDYSLKRDLREAIQHLKGN